MKIRNKKQAVELMKLYKSTNNEEIKRALLEYHQKLAYLIANRYCTTSQDEDDIKSIALIALNRAIDKYDVNSSAQFSTFAGVVIRKDILKFYRKINRQITYISLDDCFIQEGHSGKTGDDSVTPFVDTLVSEDMDMCDRIIQNDEIAKAYEFIDRYMKPRTKLLINYLFGINGFPQKEPKEVCKILNVSHQRLYQKRKEVLKSMKDYIVNGVIPKTMEI